MEYNSLPYRAEYAKSGRASCRTCKNAIAKDELRLAVMVQSKMFDGKQPMWHHFTCFFGRCRPKDIADIEHFQSLRWEDQEKIKKKIENLSGAAAPSSKGRGKKRDLPNNIPHLKDFTIGYAKSSKSKCKLCEEFISKNEVRISKKDYESESALQYGPHERWHHVDCFLKVRKELDFYASGTVLPGYKTLAPDDQKMIKNKITEEKKDTVDSPSPAKKLKESIPSSVEEEMKKQNKLIFKFRDQLEGLKKTELICLLEYNNQQVPEGVTRILDRLADGMAFGALKNCEKCNGQLVFRSGVGFVCTGHISEWARCDYQTLTPSRVIFKVPNELKENYTFLEKYKGKLAQRVIIETSPKAKEEEKNIKEVKQELEPKLKSSAAPLDSLQFLIHKVDNISSDVLKSRIKDLGGKIVSKFSENITAVISIDGEINKPKLAKVLSCAKDFGIPVLSCDFFDISIPISREEIVQKLKNNMISTWDTDVSKRIPIKEELVLGKSSYPKKSMYKSDETVKKITLKDGLVVDPDSGLDQVAHVYRRGNDIYSTVLSLTDVQTNRNSFYKLQILEGDKKKKYWLFRGWGRIGTIIGGTKIDKYMSVEDCIVEFKKLFEEKTGNVWDLRDQFKKIPGKMMMLEINYEEQKGNELIPKPKLEIASLTLHKAVQDLITLIFDIEAMKKTMMEFELDLEKMPLGKISQTQIYKAFGILSELQNSLTLQDDKSLITDRTNRFYTLVPHDYGVNNPPLLNNEKIIKEKIEILNSLMEIEIAYKLLQECQDTGNTIDDYYKKLNAHIIVLERGSNEFQLIETYVKNTHAETHTNYTLEIEEIFKVERNGEAKRFKKFNKLPNKKLLWHGSRLTNFVGILSKGLRIAPPEAPSTGYMFGKGIYFADRVSKSANYCMTSKKNPTGLLLLCEVALGKMYELTNAKCIEKLPSGKHSVIGLGKTIPDPNEKAITPSGAEVPLGGGVEADIKESSLLYNEYIVYDVSQVKIQYLLRMKFNYKV